MTKPEQHPFEADPNVVFYSDQVWALNGTIKNARKEPAYKSGTYFVIGNIYNDSTGRFEDGALVTTGTLQQQLTSDIWETTDSLYRIEWAA
jgi:hypothetical protein